MSDSETLYQAILCRLSSVIDPETGADVVRMRLIENLHVDDGGVISYTFRPSSPLCPIAIPLALKIKRAVAEMPGVSQQQVQVTGYLRAEELTHMLNQPLPEDGKGG